MQYCAAQHSLSNEKVKLERIIISRDYILLNSISQSESFAELSNLSPWTVRKVINLIFENSAMDLSES